ncbi:peptidase family C78-domain-containing protein [Bombardia bombarda]|uniref:Peptidase family C78-domain-containing protein n=1 Tax=Bombardia bombarda TaxID=252184 RepID=A0AA39XJI7_9PEZI|nr:peptidase family C78-domain-containing protein [Bombardia bombarda]
MTCPFCGWELDASKGEYAMLLHMDTLHPEGVSPFAAVADPDAADLDANPDSEDDAQYVECPIESCGEALLLAEMEYHLDLHAQEEADVSSTSPKQHGDHHRPPKPTTTPTPSSTPSSSLGAHREGHRHRHSGSPDWRSPSSTQAKAISMWKTIFRIPGSTVAASSSFSSSPRHRHAERPAPEGGSGKRLGKAQLGRFAHEEQMPEWLVAHLKKGGQKQSEGVIPVLALLLDQCSSTKYAYLCHPSVIHVSKLKREGGFCGYRNIQVLSSYVTGTKFKGHHHFDKQRIPSIFQIQDFIEAAWDRGINPHARLETGGIKGTRKYIGTPEALAMFRYLDIPCDAQGFKFKDPGKAEALLLEAVEDYFQMGVEDPTQRIRLTRLPPIYFQHAGHSMTIIGLERLKSGATNLLVFDPNFHDAKPILDVVGVPFQSSHPSLPGSLLKPYRRGSKYLGRYREFEILKLDAARGLVTSSPLPSGSVSPQPPQPNPTPTPWRSSDVQNENKKPSSL